MTKKTMKKVVPMLVGTLAVTMAVSTFQSTTLAEATNKIRYFIPKASSSVVSDNKGTVKYISQEEAEAMAMKKVPKNKSKITNVETLLGYDDPHYNIEVTSVLNENLTKIFTIKIDGITGKIQDVDVEKILKNKYKEDYKEEIKKSYKNNKKKDKEVVETKFISGDEAIKIALDKIGRDAELEEMELDKDDNPPKYEIEMYNKDYEYEIEIHAITGAILKFEKED